MNTMIFNQYDELSENVELDVELTITFLKDGNMSIHSGYDDSDGYDLFVLNMENQFTIYVPTYEWVRYVDDEGVPYRVKEAKWVKDKVIPRTASILQKIYNHYHQKIECDCGWNGCIGEAVLNQSSADGVPECPRCSKIIEQK